MITYFYWFAIIAIALGLVYFIGYRLDQLKIALISGLCVLIIGFAAYYFHFQQIFVKQYGGVMTIKVPDGEVHIAATWKDDNLWIENYDPETNICQFREYSRGNLLQGKVSIKNCNPLLRKPDNSAITMPNKY